MNLYYKFSILYILTFIFYNQAISQNIVTYLGNNRVEQLNAVIQLTDGTYIASGSAEDLSWVIGSPGLNQLDPLTINNVGGGGNSKIGMIIHLSDDLQELLNVVYFPSGAVQDIKHIKSNSPSGNSGEFFISGTTASGYFLAKLNNNFVNGIPTAIDWAYNVEATGEHQTHQPWDVGGDGKIVFGMGNANAKGFSAVFRLRADGSGLDIVPDWRYHVGNHITTGATVSDTWTPAFSNPEIVPNYSGVLFTSDTRCALRSWSQTDFETFTPDGNGGTKRGAWPLDMFYASACNTDIPQSTMAQGGYTNYALGENFSHKIGAIAVDKRSNHIYIGATVDAVNRVGVPTFESFVIAYTENGSKKWWSRLHTEDIFQASPAVQLDALAIDYAQGNSILVLARQKGDTNANLWSGTGTFHSDYTGGDGREIAWLGRLGLGSGNFMNSTFISGFANDQGIPSSSEPILDGWPDHNGGNANLTNTIGKITLQTDGFGNIYVIATSSGFLTTANAYQKHMNPNGAGSYRAVTTENIRVYTPDMQTLIYSSALSGNSPGSGSGGGNTVLNGAFPIHNGVVVVGYQLGSNSGGALGSDIPVSNVPQWGRSTPENESAIFGKLQFSQVEALFLADPASGNCVGQTTVFTDSSYSVPDSIISWQWDFGDGATPATASTKGPHSVTWATPGVKTISLTVTNQSNLTDNTTISYTVSDAPTANITTDPANGSIDPAPISVELSSGGAADPDATYLWEVQDLVKGNIFYTSDIANHEFLMAGDYAVKLTVSKDGCTVEDSTILNVTGGPGPIDPEFTVMPDPPCVNSPVIFEQVLDSNAVSWKWSFGEGATPSFSESKGPHSVIYTTPGPKTAILVVGNGVVERSHVLNFEVTPLPISDFNMTIGAGGVVDFQTTGPAGVDYEWNFGNPLDSTGNTSTVQNPSYTYSYDGSYVVSLEATNPNGCTSTFIDSLNILGLGTDTIFADFTIIPSTQTCVFNTVTITDMSRGYDDNKNLQGWTWYFEEDAIIDGDSLEQGFVEVPGPVNVYWTTPGTKRITLVTSGQDDASTKVASQTFEVFPYPNAFFNYSTEDCDNLTVSFSAQSGTGNYYSWDFGDDDTASPTIGSVVSHTYPSDGQYTVTLTVVNNGCTSVVSRQINIGDCSVPQDITAGIIARPARLDCADQRFIFESASTGTYTDWQWDFGAGSNPASASGPGPHEVTIGGGTRPVTVSLTVTDQDGNTKKVTAEIP